jgi:ketosteroid isomerase-like protein
VSGKYIVVWQLGDDGAWRLHRDIWNMNAAPAE